jgi:hypothetical protein
MNYDYYYLFIQHFSTICYYVETGNVKLKTRRGEEKFILVKILESCLVP